MSLYLPASILMYFHVCSHVPSSLVFKQPKFRIVPYYWNFIKVCFLCVSQGLILRNFRSRKSPNLGQKGPILAPKIVDFQKNFLAAPDGAVLTPRPPSGGYNRGRKTLGFFGRNNSFSDCPRQGVIATLQCQNVL